MTKKMNVGRRNGKRNAENQPTTLQVVPQSNKLARRAVRKFALTHSSRVGGALFAQREQAIRALHPKEKRALRRQELERRANAQANVVMMDQPVTFGVDVKPTKTEREILVLDSDQDEPLRSALVQRKID